MAPPGPVAAAAMDLGPLRKSYRGDVEVGPGAGGRAGPPGCVLGLG